MHPHPRLTLGLDAGLNPWISPESGSMVPGTLNVHTSIIFRLWSLGPVTLRSTGELGASVLLTRIVGAPPGSVGPYLALRPLGVEIPIDRHFRFTADPIGLSIPIPQTRGVPLIYLQYQVSVGIAWRA